MKSTVLQFSHFTEKYMYYNFWSKKHNPFFHLLPPNYQTIITKLRYRSLVQFF